jgi:3-oxoacyl-[acyl-carrier protein] reductase
VKNGFTWQLNPYLVVAMLRGVAVVITAEAQRCGEYTEVESIRVMTVSANNRVALVTGGSRGIGRAISVALAVAGYDVMINYVSNESAAAEARDEALKAADEKVSVETCRADISNLSDHKTLLAAVKEKFGHLDLLVNNAGVSSGKRVDLLEAEVDNFERLIDINLKGPYFLTQSVAKWMIEQRAHPELKDYSPAIVTISSVSAYAASPERGDYCVSKAGLSMMTKLFALRLANEGINVYEVRPGVIATDMTATVKDKYDRMIEEGLTPINRWGSSEDVARAVAAIASGSFPFSTGEVINVDGGFHLRRL